MKNVTSKLLALGLLLLITSCANKPSLQEYFVQNQQNPNFLSLDLPASILNLQKKNLTAKEQKAIASLKKLNLLAFRLTPDNANAFTAEKTKIKAILQNDDFVVLMKIKSSYGTGVIKYLGNEDAINEVIIYGDSSEKGFALIRVLGKDMNPAQLIPLIQAMQKSDYKGEGLEQIGELLKSS